MKKIMVYVLAMSMSYGGISLFAAQGDPSGTSDILYAARRGIINSVMYWLDRGADIEAKDEKGNTPLMLGLSSGDIVRLLLDRGANIEARDIYGYTPLMRAVGFGYSRAVELLLDRGADVEAIGGDGYTPLMVAVYAGYLRKPQDKIEAKFMPRIREEFSGIICMLFDAGARVDDTVAGQIFDQALEIGDSVLLQALLAKVRVFAIDKFDAYGETALIRSVVKNSFILVELLVKNGANPYIRDSDGFDAFYYAKKDPRMIAILNQQEVSPAPHVRFVAADQLTPTEVHYKSFSRKIELKYGGGSKYGKEGSSVLDDPIVRACIKQERIAYGQGKYVLYRAEPGVYRVYQYFLEELYKLVRSSRFKQSFIFTRFFKSLAEPTVTEYMDEYSRFDQEKDRAFMYDMKKDDLLSANIPLFGNVDSPGSCTWDYFLNSSEGAGSASLQKMFETIFRRYDFDKKYIAQLLALQAGLLENVASLQQVIIPNDVVDNIVMLSRGFYLPWNQKIDGIGDDGWDDERGYYTKISPLLDAYKTGSVAVNDSWEVFILMNAIYGLNPESGIEFNIHTRLPEERLAIVKEQVKKITNEMFGEWLAKQVGCEKLPKGVESEELCHALRTFGKGDIEAQEEYFRAVKKMRTPEAEAKAVKARMPQEEMKEEESKEEGDPLIREKGAAIAEQAARLAREKSKPQVKKRQQ